MEKEFPFYIVEGENAFEYGLNYGRTLKPRIEQVIKLYKGIKNKNTKFFFSLH